jgi:hypothetical protein
MPDYADWTESIELLGSEIQVPFDLQGAYIQMPMDIQASYIQVPVDIQGQYVTLDIRIVASDVTLNVNISSQTANINVNLAASEITLGVAIQSSAATLNVNITGQTVSALNVNITGSVATLNVNITGSTATLNVNITGSTGNVNINLNAQSVAVKSQGEWAPQAEQQKYVSAYGGNIPYGSNVYVDYTVPSGKTLYITHVSFAIYSSGVDTTTVQAGELRLWNYTTATRLVYIGGNCGNGLSFPTPIKIPSGQTVRLTGLNMVNHNCDILICWGGYEL